LILFVSVTQSSKPHNIWGTWDTCSYM
jgi:hypothetical protein